MWRKAASLFVEIEEPKREVKEVTQEDAVKAAAEAVKQEQAKPTTVPTPVYSGSINPEMAEMLSNAVQAADLEGFDYLEFKEALCNPALSALPEAQRFSAVFAIAKASSLTLNRLISSVDHYMSVLDGERQKFQAQLEQVTQSEVVAREDQIALNQQMIADAQTQIVELNQKVAELQQQNIQLNSEKAQEDIIIKNTAASFEATFNAAYGTLQEDKNKITQYIRE